MQTVIRIKIKIVKDLIINEALLLTNIDFKNIYICMCVCTHTHTHTFLYIYTHVKY